LIAPRTRRAALVPALVAVGLGTWADAPVASSPPPARPAPAPLVSAGTSPSTPIPFGAGERLTFKMTYARLLAGRAYIAVGADEREGRPVFRLTLDVKSEGFFAWLFRYKVDDHTAALWDPATGCSLGIEKRLREGRARRDQVVRIDPVTGTAFVEDVKIKQKVFQVGPCPLDVFSAFFVARLRGLGRDGDLTVRVFDNGKLFDLPFRHLGYETLDLPLPLGRRVLTQIAEPIVPKGAGLFAQEGRIRVWVTADERRIPVRVRSKVPIGSVSGDLESYTPPKESVTMTKGTDS
jgi:hypothetical protein